MIHIFMYVRISFLAFSLHICVPQVTYGTKGRAWMTLPQEFSIAKSSIPLAGVGVFAKTFIKKHTWLGEYEGRFRPLNTTDAMGSQSYAWVVWIDAHQIYTYRLSVTGSI